MALQAEARLMTQYFKMIHRAWLGFASLSTLEHKIIFLLSMELAQESYRQTSLE